MCGSFSQPPSLPPKNDIQPVFQQGETSATLKVKMGAAAGRKAKWRGREGTGGGLSSATKIALARQIFSKV